MAQPSTQPPQRPSNKSTHSQDSYNHGGMITFLLAMGVSILFFIALLLFHPGIDLKEVGDQSKKVESVGTVPPAGAQAPAEPQKK